MESFAKKFLTLLLAASFLLAQTAFAQEVAPDASTTPPTDTSVAPATDTATSPADTSTPADAATTPAASSTPGTSAPAESVNPQDPAAVQDTTTTQAAVTADQLEGTVDPNATSTVDDSAIIPIVDATSTATTTEATDPTPVVDATAADPIVPVDAGTSTVDVAAPVDTSATSTDDTTPVPPPVPLVADDASAPEAPAALPLYIEAPAKPKFGFAVTGKHMDAKKQVTNADGSVSTATVTQALTPVVDNSTGSVSVSGSCSDKYFVVLLYQNAGDYAGDPGSYIVNKAFPCANNTFSYAISDLPATLPNGIYYLLVGQEGDKGSWAPISSLSEITINRTQ